MSRARQILEAITPRNLLKKADAGLGWLYDFGFEKHPTREGLVGKHYPRPWPTPYDYGPITLEAHRQEDGKWDVGVCTMGQWGYDYPDIWLGSVRPHMLLPVIKRLLPVVKNAAAYKLSSEPLTVQGQGTFERALRDAYASAWSE